MKLIDGCIPKGQNCPFKDKCELDDAETLGVNTCHHPLVKDHIDYSCAIARAFDIQEEIDPHVCVDDGSFLIGLCKICKKPLID